MAIPNRDLPSEVVLAVMSPEISPVPDPDRTAADWIEEGCALYDLGRYADSIICFDMAIKLDPDFPKAWYNKDVALGKLQRHDLALDCYDRTVELRPDRSDVWNNQGAALAHLGMYEEALMSFDKAIELDSRNAEAGTTRAQRWESLGCTRRLWTVWTGR